MTNNLSNPGDDFKGMPARTDDGVTIDFQRYLGVFISNWYWFVIVLFFSLALAYAINIYSEPVFSVTSSLLIQDDKNGAEINSLDKMIPGGDIFRSQQNLKNEIGILKSFALNKRVMDSLPDFHITCTIVGRRGIAERRLYKEDCPFQVITSDLAKQPIDVPVFVEITSSQTYNLRINGIKETHKNIRFNEDINLAGFSFKLILRDPDHFNFNKDLTNRYKFKFESTSALANIYRYLLRIEPIDEDATVVSLSITGNVVRQQAEYLNTLMDMYIRSGLDYKNITADSTINFIDRQLKVISDSLNEAENLLQEFRLNNKLISLSNEGEAIQSKLNSFESERTSIRLKLQYYEYLSDYIHSKNDSSKIISPSVMGVEDQVLLRLVDDFGKLKDEKKKMQYSFSSDIPSLDLIEARITDAKKAIEENIFNSVGALKLALDDVNSRISDVETSINRLPKTERDFITIQRKFDLNNTVYIYMLEKRAEAGIAKASRVSSNRVIDVANPYNSVKIQPRTNRNYIIAFFIGLLLPALYIFLIDQLNTKILDRKDIISGTSVPIIGFVGHNEFKNEIPVSTNPSSSLAESFRSIRTSLKYFVGSDNCIISITSTVSGEGKTFISTNLATVFALLGKKTLLIGLDLRKPKLNSIFGFHDSDGLSSYLIGESDFNNIVKETGITNLFYVPSGPIPPNPAELIESEKMKEFIALAKVQFDFIILDTPPIGIVTDAILLGSFADVNLFVIRQRFSSKNTLEFIQNIYERKEINKPLIVVNDINIAGYYGYGLRYGSGFYSGYGYDYGYGQYGSYNYGKPSNYYVNK